MKSKLYRNLRPGDKFRVTDRTDGGKERTAIITVSKVQEGRVGHFTGERRWEVHGDYPWWFQGPVVAYSGDRVNLV
jgi:hypothetical protein